MTDNQNQPTEGQQQATATQPVNNGANDGLLTQDEVNKLIGARVREAQQSAVKKLLEELGFDKADDLKAVVTTAKAKADAEKSELEKMQDRLAKLETDKKAAEERAASVERQRLVDKRDAAIERALNGATKPAAVLAWLNTYAKSDLEAVMSDNGTIDGKKVDELIGKAKKELPELFKSTAPGSPSNNDGRAPQPDARKIVGERIIRSL